MHRFFSLLLIASVLAHATFGCCLHHAHASEEGSCSSAHVHASLSSLGHSHEHPSVSQSKLTDSSPVLHNNSCGDLCGCIGNVPFRGQYPCSDATCSFARTECASPSIALDAGDGLAVAVLPELTHQPRVAYARQSIFSRSSVVSLTLRRHLVLTVLVI